MADPAPTAPIETFEMSTLQNEKMNLQESNVPPSYSAIPPAEPHITNVFINPPPMAWGPNPQPVKCPYCHNDVTTRVETTATNKTHIYAILLCLCGCCCCCCLPYCMDSCLGRKHFCPQCRTYLGCYNN